MVIQASSCGTKEEGAMQQNGNNGHRRCFSASFANIYDVFRCKQLQPEAVAMSARSLVSSSRAYHRHLHTKATETAAPPKKMIDSSSSARPKSSRRIGVPTDDHVDPRRAHEQQQQPQRRMMDLAGAADAEVVAARKTRALAEMQAMVRGLQSGEAERLAAAAADIRLAARRDGEARTTLAMMGAIPPLVGMLDSSSSTPAQHSSAALLALLNLAVRNDQNKAAIVSAGAVPRIIRLLLAAPVDPLLHESAAAALLSLSALDANKPAIGALGAAEPLVRMIIDRSGSNSSSQARKDAMGALYNLSICPANAPPMVEAGAVPALLPAIYEAELCGRAVATAGNLVATPAGRRAMAAVPGSALVFVDVLASSSWGRCCSGGCSSPSRRNQQERAAYVVMVMAQYSPAQRRAMSRGGAASALLELVLVGSSVAQERASRALECLRAADDDDSSCRRRCCFLLEDDEDDDEQHRQHVEKEMVSEERRAVNRMVQQSLRINMQRITKRACLPSFAATASSALVDHLAITATPSSRSLPY